MLIHTIHSSSVLTHLFSVNWLPILLLSLSLIGFSIGMAPLMFVLMGEIIHPMEANHYIVHVDFYLDKAFLGRVHLTPVKLNPACSLHLKAGEGELTVIEFCNQHGNWMTRKNL